MLDYINGMLYGIKTSIKIMSKLNHIKDSEKVIVAIRKLCNLQDQLKTKTFNTNIELWQYVQFEVLGNYWGRGKNNEN